MRVAALALVCLALPHVVAAQCGSTTTFKDFVLLVQKYRAGDDAPVRYLANCPSALGPIRDGLLENRNLVAAARTPEPRYQQLRLDPQLVPAAAMLLFDAGHLSFRWGRHDLPGYLTTAVAALQVPRDVKDTFAAEWHAVVARWLRVRFLFDDAERLLASARQWMPDEPMVLYESGVTAELLATAYRRPLRLEKAPSTAMGYALFGPGQPIPRGAQGLTLTHADSRKLLEDAASWLEAVVEREPLKDLPNARLAHVRLLQGDTASALRLGDAVMAHAGDAGVAYVGSLLSGAALEQDGDLDGAAVRYQRAIARYPPGQSARVALSEVLQREGRYDDARRAVEALFGMTEVREPWWGLMMDSEPYIDGLLGDLRMQARR